MTALKPVRAEQVRRPEWKQNWTVTLWVCFAYDRRLSLRPVGSIHISCVLQPESRHRRPKLPRHHPLIIWNIFIHFLALSFCSVFIFFWLKRPSTSARTVVPLTTPLGSVQAMSSVYNKECATVWQATVTKFNSNIRDCDNQPGNVNISCCAMHTECGLWWETLRLAEITKKSFWQRWDSNPRPRRDWCLKPAP